MTEDDDDTTVAELHTQLSEYFSKLENKTMVMSFLLYARVMDDSGEQTVWIVPSDDMDLTHKMGVAAYLVENFRGAMQHSRSDEDED